MFLPHRETFIVAELIGISARVARAFTTQWAGVVKSGVMPTIGPQWTSVTYCASTRIVGWPPHSGAKSYSPPKRRLTSGVKIAGTGGTLAGLACGSWCAFSSGVIVSPIPSTQAL